eukprot:12576019-Alexandrium_andersonii.AAC.1
MRGRGGVDREDGAPQAEGARSANAPSTGEVATSSAAVATSNAAIHRPRRWAVGVAGGARAA